MPRITTKSAKAKGRRAQDAVRDAILAAFPELTPADLTCAIMGEGGADIQRSPKAREVFPFCTEVKARAAIGLPYDALDQARRYAANSTPIAVLKADRREPIVVLDLKAFLALAASKARENPSA